MEQDVEDLQQASLDQNDRLDDHEARLQPVEDFVGNWSDLDPALVGHLSFPLTQDDIDLIQSAVGTTVHGKQVFTSSGTFTIPTGVTKLHVILIGGGAGGGQGGGGGSGAYCEAYNLDVTGVASIAVTIGAAGNGVSSGNGTSGGDSTFGTYLTAHGGVYGTSSGGIGGLASGGDLNIQGGSGKDLFQFSTGGLGTSHQFTGDGGSNPLGKGGPGKPNSYGFYVNGVVGTGPGAGGSGAFNDSSTPVSGGPGTAGQCIVIW